MKNSNSAAAKVAYKVAYKEIGDTFEDFYKKRREVRLDIRRLDRTIRVSAPAVDGLPQMVKLIDISPNGIGVLASHGREFARHTQVIVETPDGQRLLGWVVWTATEHSKRGRMGIRFALTAQSFFEQFHLLLTEGDSRG